MEAKKKKMWKIFSSHGIDNFFSKRCIKRWLYDFIQLCVFFQQSMFAYASYQTSGMVKEVNVVSIQDDDETDGDDIDPGFGE